MRPSEQSQRAAPTSSRRTPRRPGRCMLSAASTSSSPRERSRPSSGRREAASRRCCGCWQRSTADGGGSSSAADLATLSPAASAGAGASSATSSSGRPTTSSYLTLDEHLALAAAEGDGDEARTCCPSSGWSTRAIPRELSGGEQQRAAFAFALAVGPEIVVADEPTAELDADSAADVLAILQRLVTSGVAFVVATHDPNVTAIADHVIELEHGLARKRRRAPSGAPISLSLGWPGPSRSGRERAVEGLRARGGGSRHSTPSRCRCGRASGRTRGQSLGRRLLNVLSGWERPDTER